MNDKYLTSSRSRYWTEDWLRNRKFWLIWMRFRGTIERSESDRMNPKFETNSITTEIYPRWSMSRDQRSTASKKDSNFVENYIFSWRYQVQTRRANEDDNTQRKTQMSFIQLRRIWKDQKSHDQRVTEEVRRQNNLWDMFTWRDDDFVGWHNLYINRISNQDLSADHNMKRAPLIEIENMIVSIHITTCNRHQKMMCRLGCICEHQENDVHEVSIHTNQFRCDKKSNLTSVVHVSPLTVIKRTGKSIIQ